MFFHHLIDRLRRRRERKKSHSANKHTIHTLAVEVAQNEPVLPASLQKLAKTYTPPVIFFNASTRLSGMSLNAAFSLLASWSLRLSGTPVVYMACKRGLNPCLLGTNRDQPAASPPCRECIAQSRVNFSAGDTRWFGYHADPNLEKQVKSARLEELSALEYEGAPLGKLTLPSVRWILRRYHLLDDETTCSIFRRYILSVWNVINETNHLIDAVKPRGIVVFNGITYPEAAVRWAASQKNIPVFTHEVNLRPFSAYFTTEDATFRSVHVPEDFELSPQQSKRLDQYLEQRFQGNFKMAGVQFWKEIRGLDDSFWQRAQQFHQIVPVFTNVIFDTSQEHANSLFPHMFTWLDYVLEVIRTHPETFFVIRAHPDEARPGKASRESVAEWVHHHRVDQLDNVLFVDANEPFSSYELIRKSKFVMTYNSTIGLEATLLGTATLCAGKAHYTQLPTVYFPRTIPDYQQQVEEFLIADHIEVPPQFQQNARRFLYYQYYISGLPFDSFIEEDGIWQGYVQLKQIKLNDLYPKNSPVMKAITEGICEQQPFILTESPSQRDGEGNYTQT